jgi:hypothetical protein
MGEIRCRKGRRCLVIDHRTVSPISCRNLKARTSVFEAWFWTATVCRALKQAVHAQTAMPPTPATAQPASESDEWNVLCPDLEQEPVLGQSQPTSDQQPALDTNAITGGQETGRGEGSESSGTHFLAASALLNLS